MELQSAFNAQQVTNLPQTEPNVLHAQRDPLRLMESRASCVRLRRFLRLQERPRVFLVGAAMKPILLTPTANHVQQGRIPISMGNASSARTERSPPQKEHVSASNVLQVTKPVTTALNVTLAQQEPIRTTEQTARTVNQDTCPLTQEPPSASHVLWATETLPIRPCAAHVQQGPVLTQEKSAPHVCPEKSLPQEDLVFHVLKRKETSGRQTSAIRAQLERRLSKEESVLVAEKEKSPDPEVAVCLVLPVTNQTQSKPRVWNVLREPSRPMESLVFLANWEPSPREPVRSNVFLVPRAILPARTELCVCRVQRAILRLKEECVRNVSQEPRPNLEVNVSLALQDWETPPQRSERVRLVQQDGVLSKEESVPNVRSARIPTLEAHAKTVSQGIVPQWEVSANHVSPDGVLQKEARVCNVRMDTIPTQEVTVRLVQQGSVVSEGMKDVSLVDQVRRPWKAESAWISVQMV
jgi:hypothetical protein